MKQSKIIQAYNVTEDLSQQGNLSIKAKWILYKLRKDISSHYEFYISECRNLLSQYNVITNGNNITFESAELAQEYQQKQQEIDDFDVQLDIIKSELNLSDVSNITIQQIEALDEFIEFKPE